MTLATQKQEIFDYVHTFLGGGMIDIELDPIHYETALTKALSRFRQRSDNSVEESYLFMPTVLDQNTYTLPDEVIEVRQIFRRSIGSRSGGGDGGTLFEPFNMAYTNTYLMASSNMGGLATYDMFSQYQELLNDYIVKQWIKDYTLASCKHMLGEARSKFATIAGPQGGSTLNGDALKNEAAQEMEKLEQEVATQVTGGVGYSFTIDLTG
mgnify:CR=1 FL=1